MFSLRTSLEDCLWNKIDNRDGLPDSTFFEVFDNPIIVSSVSFTQDGPEAWVGEGQDPFSKTGDRFDRIDKTRRYNEFDGLRISFVSETGNPGLIISRTIAGTSPLFVSARGSMIHASWRFQDVVSLIDHPVPNVEMCRLFIEYGNGQTREQVISGVFALWPGEKLLFDQSGLNFECCYDVAVALPMALNDRALATGAFIELVSSVLRPVLERSKRPLLEFSGGMDSTCVAIAATALRSNFESYTLIQPGSVGLQQKRRRMELVDMLNLTDYTGPAAAVLPIDSLSYLECQSTLYDDCYRMSIMNAFEANHLQSVDLVISGLGGDELAKEHTFRRYEWEVPGHTSRSAIVSSMSNFDLFMSRGVWPSNPLAHPKVVDLCRSFPTNLRKNRMFNRLALARAGLSDGYMAPRYHETFAGVLLLQSMECDIDNIFETSIVGDYGIFDVTQLLEEVYESTKLGPSIDLVGKMYNLCKLETLLKKYVN